MARITHKLRIVGQKLLYNARTGPRKPLPDALKPKIEEIRRLRKELLKSARTKTNPNPNPNTPITEWHHQDEGENTFLPMDPPTPDSLVAPFFKKFILDRTRAALVAVPKLRIILSLNPQSFIRYCERPLAHKNFAQVTADLSVVLEVDAEVLLDLALKAERAFQIRDISFMVQGGTTLTGPVVSSDALIVGSQAPLPPIKTEG